MNQHSSTDTSTSSSFAPDAISRRAYELWEKEGKPEGSDLRHWLQAEQELRGESGNANETSASREPSQNSDITPLQGTRAGAAANASRGGKRSSSATPFSNERNGTGNASSGRRKSTSTPAL